MRCMGHSHQKTQGREHLQYQHCNELGSVRPGEELGKATRHLSEDTIHKLNSSPWRSPLKSN